MRKLILILSVIFVFSCTGNKSLKTTQIAQNYLDTYSKRKEIDKILSFYSDNFEYKNISFGTETNDSRFLIEQIYGWNDPKMKFETDESIEVEQIISNDSTIVVRGKSMPYEYNGKVVEGNNFVIWLDLDKEYKIKRQTDWFDYPMEEIIEAYQLKNAFEIQ